jgi:hypothetical protein
LILFAPGLSGEFHVLKKVVTLLLNCCGELFPLSDVPLDAETTKAKDYIAERLWKIRSPGSIYRGEQ